MNARRTRRSPAPKAQAIPGPGPITDRGNLLTEQRLPASSRLDALSIPAVLRLMNQQDALIPAAVAKAIPQISAVVRAAVKALRSGGRLIYLGAGTSGRLGVLDASECPPTFSCAPNLVVGIIAGGDKSLRRSSEGAEDDYDGAAAELIRLAVNRHDVVIGIAAGGTTPYVLGALALARRRGAVTALICNVASGMVKAQYGPGQLLASSQRPHTLVCLPVGPEVLTGSTRMKAGTATKLALNMISTAAMVQLGKAWGNLMVDLRASNAKLRDRGARIVAAQTSLTREQSLSLLDQAGGSAKVALVMARRRVTARQAQRLLDQRRGRLRPIIGPPRG